MRKLYVTSSGVIDSETGEIIDQSDLERALLRSPGGIISGNNLYPTIAKLTENLRRDCGWTVSIKEQKKRKVKTDRVGGMLYFTHLTYRFPKERKYGKRYRPKSIKWLVLNLELFLETDDIPSATEALVALAERRGIKPRYSPGSYGGALLRASPERVTGRQPAPWFISEFARIHLPGNHYKLRYGYQMRTIPSAFYLDQKSSHHTIVATTPMPHPAFLRARNFRSIEKGKPRNWMGIEQFLRIHIGLVYARIECDHISPTQEHLYPPWAVRGKQYAWIWTPELRLLDERVRVRWICGGLTSIKLDPMLLEYADWALEQLRNHKHPAIKPALLAAYGILAARVYENIEKYSISGRPLPPRNEAVTLPLVGVAHRSTVERKSVPTLQNVVARGVIEAETRTRSIEYARELEAQKIKVSQIYADGLIAITDQMPFVPSNWRIVSELTNLHSSSPNTMISDEMTRMPGIPGGRRAMQIQRGSKS